MSIKSCISFLLFIGSLFYFSGCSDNNETDYVEDISFENDLLPILTAKCALTGCHVDGGENTHGIDFTSYQSFIAGGEHGSVFIPGNAAESEIIEEMVEGKMPPPDSGYPKIPDTEIQVFIDWINQQ